MSTTGDPAPSDETTDRSSRAYLLAQIEELEHENAQLKERLSTYRDRLDAANRKIGSMGRVARVWMLVRSTVRRPWTAVRFPRELARALRAETVVAPARAVAPHTPEEVAAERAAAARLEGQRRYAARVVAERGRPARRLGDLRVAAIADRWLLDALAPECRLVALTPASWRRELEAEAPDLLLVHTAWHGPDGAWQYRLAWHPYHESIRLDAVREISSWCLEHHVPRLLWDTEPEERWGRFKALAALVDHVAAADDDSAEAYRRLPTSTAASVGRVPVGVQPLLFRPPSEPRVGDGAAFVGSVPVDVALDRREALERLLEAGARRGAGIHDLAGGADPDRFRVPAALAGSVVPHRPGQGAADVYGSASVVLLDGPGPRPGAAVPRSILEALACGAPVVTTTAPSLGPVVGDLVLQGDGVDELVAAIDAARSPLHGARVGDQGPARIRRDHAIAGRLAALAALAGLNVAPDGVDR